MVNALWIGEIQGGEHVAHGGIMGTIKVPSDFIFVEDSFLNVMKGFIKEASSGSSDLFLIRV